MPSELAMITVESLCRQINLFHQAKRPFLFGIDYEMRNAFFVADPMNQDQVLFRMDNAMNYSIDCSTDHSIHTSSTKGINLIIQELESRESYAQRFDIIYKGLQQGDTFLANLTSRTKIESKFTLKDIFLDSKSRFGVYHPLANFVSFSPEGFVFIDSDNQISSYPMKGTIDATIPNAKEHLLNDYKELCEHRTIVDLIRNDLSIVASGVKVEHFRYIDTINSPTRTLLQTSSKITGKLNDNYKLGDILLKLLPAGSISGAPKPKTIELIQNAEGVDRGFYCGVYGYYDGNEFKSAVAIRYIELDPSSGQMYYRSGGGITINSDMESEHQEVKSKIYVPH